ncbi:hypothetical protein BDQ17DRAFT_166586 [Cyathus striatus]|nr:hypothetical protein BDQ17DRAFT_166586 [Cyathus striatus]
MASSFTNSRTSTTQIITLPVIPELFDSDYLDVLLPTKTSEDVMLVDRSDSSTPTPTSPMIEALKEFATRTYTENMAKAYNSTGSPVLDAFQLISDCSSSSDIAFHLSEAWKEDPSLMLRIIWNIRSIHDGKGEKELFYRAFGWLYDNHPRTAISNLHLLVEPVCAPPKKKKHDVEGSSHGYWKDLLNILCLATRGELHDENPAFLHNQRPLWTYPKDMQPMFRPLRLNNTHGFPSGSPEKYKAWRAEQRSATYERLVRRLLDPTYRALYITVARLFAERLEKDFKLLEELEALPSNGNRLPLLKKISLAGKWAPSPGGSHDRVCNISTAIAKLMRSSQVFRPLPTVLSAPLDPRAEALVLRSVFQRWVLTELRKAIQCPEPLMSANRWSEIKYSRVPSICMNNKTELFFKHDPEGFQKYLILVESGKLRISGATLMPHELVKKVVELANPEVSRYSMLDEFKRDLWETQSRVVEGQWKTLIERLKEFGSLENSIAICDVSGSMGSLSGSIGSLFCKSRFGKRRAQPIFPAIALSLVLAHLAKPPSTLGSSPSPPIQNSSSSICRGVSTTL